MLLKVFIATCLAIALSGLGAVSAEAQVTQKSPTDKTRKTGMETAPVLIKNANLSCSLADAYTIGQGNVPGPDGKSVKTNLIEVNCKSGEGYLLMENMASKAITVVNCTQAASQYDADKKVSRCLLPANGAHHVWLKPIMAKYDTACDVEKARWLGQLTADQLDRYEIGCKGAPGALVDIPYGTSTKPITFINCLTVVGKGSECKFTTPEMAVQSLTKTVKVAQPSCVLSKARWLGRSNKDGEDFYEIGCSNEAGFIAITDLNLTFKQKYGCDRAGTLGPCQFTSIQAVAASDNQDYTNKLKAQGIACTVSAFFIHGVETRTNRELIEFSCPEQKWGLGAFIPQTGSTSKFESMDCYSMYARKRDCTLIARDLLDKNMDKAIKTEKSACDVRATRYISNVQGGGVITEIACTSKRGYVGELAKTRAGFTALVPCHIAKQRGIYTCEIPGNGTYVPTPGAPND
jgi:hypothetical protein